MAVECYIARKAANRLCESDKLRYVDYPLSRREYFYSVFAFFGDVAVVVVVGVIDCTRAILTIKLMMVHLFFFDFFTVIRWQSVQRCASRQCFSFMFHQLI